jgi:hypothetical protein
MKIKELHKAQSIYNELMVLDTEIISIEKRAIIIAEKGECTSLSVEFPSDERRAEPDSEEKTNRYMSPFDLMSAFHHFEEPKRNKKKNTDVLSFTISDIETLAVLGCLMSFKKDRRRFLMNQLTEMGYQI